MLAINAVSLQTLTASNASFCSTDACGLENRLRQKSEVLDKDDSPEDNPKIRRKTRRTTDSPKGLQTAESASF